MTVYQGGRLEEQLGQAQAELYAHLAAGRDGRCQTCGEYEPCSRRVVLSAFFARCERLPRREPGRAGLILTHRKSGG